jgi:hypothetical protein
MDSLTKKGKAVRSFEMSGTTNPATQCHIPEDMNPQMTENLEQTRCSFIESDTIMCRLKQNMEWRIEEEFLVI